MEIFKICNPHSCPNSFLFLALVIFPFFVVYRVFFPVLPLWTHGCFFSWGVAAFPPHCISWVRQQTARTFADQRMSGVGQAGHILPNVIKLCDRFVFFW